MCSNRSAVNVLRGFDDTAVIDARFSNHRFPLHFHETFVIELVTSGVDWCCGNDLAARKGDLFVHFPFAPHTGGTAKSETLKYRAIYPSEQLFADLTGNKPDASKYGVSVVISNERLAKNAETLFQCCDDENVDDRIRKIALKQVFDELLLTADASLSNGTFDGKEGSRTFEKMSFARDYLKANYTRDVTTAELSDVCDVSPFHLIRTFKKCFGITPRQFLISHRVASSKRMIASGMSIAAAAYATGFADQSHLARYFKRITSCNPRQFKRS